jgi:mRNA interferase RelE/StbE
MAYRVTLTRDARRSLLRINRPDQERLGRAIDGLADNPHSPDARPLQGSEGFLRIRVGDYRVVYFVIEETRVEAAERTGQGAPDRVEDEATEETTGAAEQPADATTEQIPEVRIIRIGHHRDVYRGRLPRRP